MDDDTLTFADTPVARRRGRSVWVDIGPIADALARRRSWPSRDSDPDSARLYRAWLRAQERGQLSLVHADEICVRILGLHPVEVYGHAWFDTAEV